MLALVFVDYRDTDLGSYHEVGTCFVVRGPGRAARARTSTASRSTRPSRWRRAGACGASPSGAPPRRCTSTAPPRPVTSWTATSTSSRCRVAASRSRCRAPARSRWTPGRGATTCCDARRGRCATPALAPAPAARRSCSASATPWRPSSERWACRSGRPSPRSSIGSRPASARPRSFTGLARRPPAVRADVVAAEGVDEVALGVARHRLTERPAQGRGRPEGIETGEHLVAAAVPGFDLLVQGGDGGVRHRRPRGEHEGAAVGDVVGVADLDGEAADDRGTRPAGSGGRRRSRPGSAAASKRTSRPDPGLAASGGDEVGGPLGDGPARVQDEREAPRPAGRRAGPVAFELGAVDDLASTPTPRRRRRVRRRGVPPHVAPRPKVGGVDRSRYGPVRSRIATRIGSPGRADRPLSAGPGRRHLPGTGPSRAGRRPNGGTRAAYPPRRPRCRRPDRPDHRRPDRRRAAPAEQHCVVDVVGQEADGRLVLSAPTLLPLVRPGPGRRRRAGPQAPTATSLARVRRRERPRHPLRRVPTSPGSSITVSGSGCTRRLHEPRARRGATASRRAQNFCSPTRFYDGLNLTGQSESTLRHVNLVALNNRADSIKYG